MRIKSPSMRTNLFYFMAYSLLIIAKIAVVGGGEMLRIPIQVIPVGILVDTPVST